ncbi:uncharacterized protein LOC129230182 [Uloborus diversus]|uniref:uncharacterized protein LOC129230182 n=1 Tax=Uloborus diversus TaxID=327109 RepID=UPI00240957C4|nr:uncharacterized protein LOC129230182 [Uloborus diversus]
MDTYSEIYPLESALWVGQVPVAEVIVAQYALNDMEDKLNEINVWRQKKMWEKLFSLCKMEIGRMREVRRENKAEILVDAGCLTDIHDDDGYIPLQLPSKRECLGVMTELITGGADTAQKDRQGGTFLHMALQHSVEAAAEMLVAAIPDLNVPDRQRRTPCIGLKETMSEVIVTYYALNDMEDKLDEINVSRQEKMCEKLLPMSKIEIDRMREVQVKGS